MVVADRRQPVRDPARLDRRHAGVPLGRQVDRRRSSCPTTRKWAAAIEQAHSDGNGLLAHHGSSYGNLFSGDAERAVLTMSGAGRRKEGRTGAGYFGYFSRPGQATRTLLASIVEIGRERLAAGAAAAARRRAAGRARLGLRAAAHVHDGDHPRRVGAGRDQRHVRGAGGDLRRHARLRRGRPPLRSRTRRRPRRAARPRPPARPHRADRRRGRRGRTRSSCCPTTARRRARRSTQRTGQTLAELVGRAVRRCRRRATPTPKPGAPSRRRGCARPATRTTSDDGRWSPTSPIVLGSGSLGLISIPGEPRRLTREEIDARYPRLIAGLASPSGDRLRARAPGERVVGRARRPAAAATWPPARSIGDDPLAPFGPRAPSSRSREVDGYRTVADLMVNSRYDPELEEVAAFEDQVSSHGGLGGPQTHPFLLYPAELTPPGSRSSPPRRCTGCSRAGSPTSAIPSRPVARTRRAGDC